MKRFGWVVMVVVMSSSLEAGRWRDAILGHSRCWPNCAAEVECDDYCRKPPPCAYTPLGWECPDYCRKCFPPVKGAWPFTCDDYNRKPFPWPNCPANRRFYAPHCHGACCADD